MPISNQLKFPFSTKKKRLHFDLPIAQRLTLGFLLTALIAGLLAGSTALARIQSLHQQSDFYQQLLKTKTTLAEGNDFLIMINFQMHDILALTHDTISSTETLQDDKTQLQTLIKSYDTLLNRYVTSGLLQNHPDQISLLSMARQDTQATTQAGLAKSALRTWAVFKQVQLQILKDIIPGDNDPQKIADGINSEHLQGEPMFSDTQSALLSLIHFNDKMAQSASDAVTIEESNQILTTTMGIILAIISIALIGLFISNTVVYRIKQIRQITKAAEQGEAKDRIHVTGKDEIADISTSVNAMLEIIASEQEIKVASELKDQFIASISHELRNPLTNVFGWLEILIDYDQELDAETRMRFLSRAMYGCQEIMQIVYSVLDATRVGRGMAPVIQLEEVSLNPLIQSVIDNMNPRTTEHYHIQTVTQEEFVALADPQYVRQIVQNLLNNACKYSPKQSIVTISIQRSSQQIPASLSTETNNLYIRVKDNGPGIPPQDIPRLFQKFSRLQRDKTIHGTGLGLYLCKQLVESMGGQIWVESTGIAGEGCSFFFTLPEASLAEDNSADRFETTDSSDLTYV